MSGLLGSIISAVVGGGGGAPNVGTLLQTVLNQKGGGISALLSRFQEAGLGEQAASWISTGPNQLVSPDQIDQVFSADEIQEWASGLGLQPDQIKGLLAEALPQVVNHATPDGEIPPSNASPDITSVIGKFFR